MRTHITILMLLIILIASSAVTSVALFSYPSDVIQALEKSGKNRSELERVLAHYSATGDSSKMRAAYFLIGNMEGHSM